jgi:hypothetical protein
MTLFARCRKAAVYRVSRTAHILCMISQFSCAHVAMTGTPLMMLTIVNDQIDQSHRLSDRSWRILDRDVVTRILPSYATPVKSGNILEMNCFGMQGGVSNRSSSYLRDHKGQYHLAGHKNGLISRNTLSLLQHTAAAGATEHYPVSVYHVRSRELSRWEGKHSRYSYCICRGD